MTRNEFIEKAGAVYGEKYLYNNVIDGNVNSKVSVICPIHGEWEPIRKNFLNGHGCKQCAMAIASSKKKKSIKQFVEDARKAHGTKYDYSKVEYTGSRSKVCIVCPKHGDFWQLPYQHTQGSGCKKCGDEYRGNKARFAKENFVKKSREIWGDKYSYDKVKYVSSTQKVCITCKKHGDFWQTPANHSYYEGCPVCSRLAAGEMVFGHGVNDEVTPTSMCNLAYNHWKMILERSYDEGYKIQHPTYKDVTMDETWKRFSVFKRWFDANYVKGYDLDKDLLSANGDKRYSPKTCCFIPHDINVLLCQKKESKTGLPLGVRKIGNVYNVRVCLHNGKRISKSVKTIEEAMDFYREMKHKIVVDVAETNYANGMIDKRVYDGLLKYKFQVS